VSMNPRKEIELEIKDLRFSYDQNPTLHGIDLRVSKGEITGLVGPNGSGKTTLLGCIAGSLKTYGGEIILAGRKLSTFSTEELARRVAMVEQETRVGFDFTVWQVVEMGRFPYRGRFQRGDNRDEEAVERALEITGVGKFSSRPVSKLSGGERQRVFLALALAQEPELLLMDEPTANLDLNYQVKIMDTVSSLVKEGLTTLVALHDLNLTASYAEKVALLEGGELIKAGPPAEVFQRERLERTFGVNVGVEENPFDGSVQVYPLGRRRVKETAG